MIIDRYSIVEMEKERIGSSGNNSSEARISADYVDYPSRVVEIRRPWDQVYLVGKG